MQLDELKEHCLKTLKQTKKFPTKTFEEHALVLRLIRNQTSVIEELEKIKTEIDEIVEREMKENKYWSLGLRYSKKIIDNHIKELKGENNE